MEKIKKIIILMCVLSLIIIIAILFLVKHVEKKNNEITEPEGEVFDYENAIIEDVTNQVEYFTVTNCITRYFDQINKDNFKYYESDGNGEYTFSASQEEINQDNYKYLSKKYIEDNNITIENVDQYIEEINEKVIYTPLKMKVLIAPEVNKYITYGFIQNTQNEFLKEVYIIVNLDFVNKTFSIEPLLEKYNSIDEIKIENENEPIEKNENNTYTDAKINYEYVSKAYFNAYKRMCLSNPTIAYTYLDNEYKAKRFSTLENYIEYVEKNKNELTGISIKEYLVNNKSGYTEYVCKDQYKNLYIFREKNLNEFSILLDTYTITTEEFKNEYNKADEQQKVMMNVDKWIQMLNNRDYNAAFNVLDETFRNNNFNGDVNEFEKFMRKRYYAHYEVQYLDFSKQAGDIYTQEIAFSEIGEVSTSENIMTIIMKLEDDMKFVMSFTKDS